MFSLGPRLPDQIRRSRRVAASLAGSRARSPRRFLEQQSTESPLREPQQEQSGEAPTRRPQIGTRTTALAGDAKRVVNRGMLTALAEHCGLDWKNQSFAPFMSHERAKNIWSDKQMAYIGLMHGITQGAFVKLFSQKEPCDDVKNGRFRRF